MFASNAREDMRIGDSKLSSNIFLVFLSTFGVFWPLSTESTRHVDERVLSPGRNMRYTRSPLDMTESWLPTL